MSPELKPEQSPTAEAQHQPDIFEKINNAARTRLAIAGIALASVIGVAELSRSSEADAANSSTAETSATKNLSPKWVMAQLRGAVEEQLNPDRPAGAPRGILMNAKKGVLTGSSLIIRGRCVDNDDGTVRSISFADNRVNYESCMGPQYGYDMYSDAPKGHFTPVLDRLGDKIAASIGVDTIEHGQPKSVVALQRVAWKYGRNPREIPRKSVAEYRCGENEESGLPQVKTIILRKNKKPLVRNCK